MVYLVEHIARQHLRLLIYQGFRLIGHPEGFRISKTFVPVRLVKLGEMTQERLPSK